MCAVFRRRLDRDHIFASIFLMKIHHRRVYVIGASDDDVPAFQLAAPPGFHVSNTPKGELVPVCLVWYQYVCLVFDMIRRRACLIPGIGVARYYFCFRGPHLRSSVPPHPTTGFRRQNKLNIPDAQSSGGANSSLQYVPIG